VPGLFPRAPTFAWTTDARRQQPGEAAQSGDRRTGRRPLRRMCVMTDTRGVPLSLDDLAAAQAGFLSRLRRVRPDHWARSTPCTEWTVRRLVNHVVLGELGYALLLHGGSGPEFLAIQRQDAVGEDPVGAYERATAHCRSAFRGTGALGRTVDYPLGAVSGRQLLGLRVTETVLHTWDLASAINADDRLDRRLVEWSYHNLEWTYRGVAESPATPGTTHVFFAAPQGVLPPSASVQDQLLYRTGRRPRAVSAG
jgi:uncharacterized protein (TIGR03086 family)